MAEIKYQYGAGDTVVAIEYDGEVYPLDADDQQATPPRVLGGTAMRDVHTSIRSTVEDLQDSYKDGAIIVGVEAHHGGYTNSNSYHYLTKGLRKYADTWTTPYGRPYLVDHDPSGEPRGRVVGAKFVKTGKTTGFHDLDVRIGHPEEIDMVMDSRALTVSVGSRPVDSVECSVCNHDMFKDGNTPKRYELDGKPRKDWLSAKAPGIFGMMGLDNEDLWSYDADDNSVLCRHMRGAQAPRGGKQFDDTFWYLHGQHYREVSRVNIPADVNTATGEFAHIREILEQTDGLEDDARVNLIIEELSRVESTFLDRARFTIASEKDVYRPSSATEAQTLAKATNYACMFDKGLWQITLNAYPVLNIEDQVQKYYQAGGTFVYRPSSVPADVALTFAPKAFADWLRGQVTMEADEKQALDRLYTRAYIRKESSGKNL